MDVKSVPETMREREIRAFVAGFEERTIERRGYGLSEEERAEIEAEAVALYAEPVGTVTVGNLAA